MKHFRSQATIYRFALVLVSLVLSLWHFGPLGGTFPALVLTTAMQVMGVGYWTAQALGLWRRPESLIVRIVWMAACGLGITIVLGALCRLLLVPLSVYVIGLHVLMVVLSLIPSRRRAVTPITRQTLPFYGLLVIICVVYVGVGWARNRMRFADYPDQTYPVSLADWWINHPQPEAIVSRNAAEASSITYWSSDGLTYLFAAWGWSSGSSAVQVIWYGLTPLFAWLIPLAHFALVYVVTKRLDRAAWATGIVFIFALTTLNTPSVLGGAWMYGQEAAFHLTTLRYFSTALLLPLTLFAFFHGVRRPTLRYVVITGILILALALTHPRQFLVLFTAMYAILGLRWIVRPGKRRLRPTLVMASAALPALIVPLWQYGSHLQNQITPDLLPSLAGAASISQQVIEPAMLLFHPFVALALVLSVVAVIRLRRSLAAQYALATLIVMMVLSYVPPIFNLILRVLGSYYGIHFVFELFYIFPIGLILGCAVSYGHDWLIQRVRVRQWMSRTLVSACFVGTGLVLLIEPFPMVRSARDQINALDQMQAIRDIQPFEEALLARLSTLSVRGNRVVYLTSNRIANFVIEGVPNAIVTGGRNQSNAAYAGSTRFFDGPAPWLDDQDIAFLQQYKVQYIVLEADNSRIPQLMLQPERFEWMGATAGYVIFSVKQPLNAAPVDALFAAMNSAYAAEDYPRWDESGFHLERQVNAADWQDVIEQWQQAASGDLQRYGLAVSRLMSGVLEPDVWQGLSSTYPDVFALTDTYAHFLLAVGNNQAAVDRLLNEVEQNPHETRVLAAGTLLSKAFFHLLSAPQLETIIHVADTDPLVWANLMEWNHEQGIRERAALLMSARQWDTAAAWLARIPEVKLAPQDLVAKAALELVAGHAEAARLTLKPAVMTDWIEPHLTVYANDWSDAANSAARMYYTITEPSADEISPTVIAETGSVFISKPAVDVQGSTLLVSAAVGNFTPAYAPQAITVEVEGTDQQTSLAVAEEAVTLRAGVWQRISVPVQLPNDVSPQTRARVIIKLQYDAQLVYQSAEVETTLP